MDTTPTDVLVPSERWESVVAEGPWVELHDGHFALMYSGNFVRTPQYALGVAMSDDPAGPSSSSRTTPG